jgi:hypothetical protein
MLIKQSTALRSFVLRGRFWPVILPRDRSDHDGNDLQNGAAFGAPAGAHRDRQRWYKIAANATDSNTIGSLLVHATATGADPFDVIHEVIEATLAKGTDLTGFNDISTANVQTELVTYGALKPTTAARTLDVSVTGEAGVDWANIGAPTTTVALTGTTIGTVTTLTNDPAGSLRYWLGSLPRFYRHHFP